MNWQALFVFQSPDGIGLGGSEGLKTDGQEGER
jgi:hypothetical protein